MTRTLTIAALILIGLLCLTSAFLIAFEVIPRYNRWSDLFALLGAFLFFGMAVMEIRELRTEQEGHRISQLLHKRDMYRRGIGDVHQNRW